MHVTTPEDNYTYIYTVQIQIHLYCISNGQLIESCKHISKRDCTGVEFMHQESERVCEYFREECNISQYFQRSTHFQRVTQSSKSN